MLCCTSERRLLVTKLQVAFGPMETESRPDPIIERELMDQLRQIATARESDTIAVIVLAGNEERGLGFSVSSALDDEQETFQLFAHVLNHEAVSKGWVSDS